MDPAVSNNVTMDETNNNGMSNGTNGHVVEPEPVKDVTAGEDPNPKTYDDLFPSLPAGKPAAGSAGGNPMGEWNRKPKVASTTVTQVFVIPVEERRNQLVSSGFGADDSYKHLKSVQDKTGAKIEMSSGKDQSLTFLITGKTDVVQRAKRDLLVAFQTQANTTIAIPKEHHKYILGKGGVKLQELEQKTATKISIPKMNENLNEINIKGTKEGIEKAIHELRLVSDEQSKQAYEVLQIPKNFHPFIQGPGGENVRKMTNGLGSVRVNIPPLSVMKDEISVAGEKEAVLAVVALIKKDFKDMERKFSEISIEVKKSQHKYVIGPKGNSINEILAETNVFVEMPSSDSTSETITLRGPQANLGLALTKVYEKANSVVKVEIPCPSWLHKYIIGKKGASIQKITNELTKVHVDFVDSGNTIRIEGPTEEVEKAREVLEGQAKNLIASTDFAEINVDAKYHKHIIGKGGSTVNKIKQETDVVINIPDSEHGINVIRIEGNKAGVAKAKKELESLVAKMENEREKDLIIENRFHRALIGPKGENISKLRDDYPEVQISFPDYGSKSEIVKLRGPRDDVDKVSKILNKSIKDLQESNYQEKVPIFKEFHKYIIGKGGATIRKIRTETDTKIDLPESGSDSDMIVLTGKKENVLQASKMLTQIQNDNIDVVSVDISIPAKIHNTMIGSGGRLIQSVMKECGNVSIKFPKPDTKSDKVTIRGPKDDVEKAKERLLSMSTDKQLSSMTAEVRAKPEHHKFLIGRNGSNVQSIRDKTGARIIFPDEKDSDRELIHILGTKEAVAAAKVELEARIKGLDNVVEEQMTVDPKYHKHFVARRGEVLRQIGEEFGGVIVSFPRSGVDSDKVTLKGAKNCVTEATARINEIVNDLVNQITIECIIEQVHHRTVMGARGSKVQRICSDFNVNIKIPDRNAGANGEVDANGVPIGNVIRVSGQSEKAHAAKQALLDLVPIDEEVEVAFEFHRYIIGAKGAEVRGLMDRHDVNIKVPPSDQQSNIIVISGSAKNIAGAREAVAAKVVELEAEKAEKALKSFEIKFEVDPEYHPKIIGRKGAVIQQLRKDFDVNVQLPKQGAPDQNIITVTGFEADTEKAKEAILAIVNEFENMTKEEVKIDRKVHSMIIGRRGAGIRKIMQDFKVDIKLPREGDADPDLVTIAGDGEAVLDCKDHLLNLEEEYLQDVQDREWMEEYTKPTSKAPTNNSNNNRQKGFEIKGAPWQGASDEAFPTLGGAGAAPSTAPAWGPRR